MEKSTHTKEYDLVRAELRAARQKARLTQRALAARLGVPHSWIAKVEAGERRIDVVEMCWFLAACGRQVPRVVGNLAKNITAPHGQRQQRGRTA